MAVHLTRRGRRAIREHGRETYPNECCGALIGRDGVGVRVVRAAEHDGRRAAPTVSRAAVGLPRGRSARDGTRAASCSGSITRIPIIRREPSQYDLDHAWPFFSYVIVSVRSGEPRELRSWRLRDDRSSSTKKKSIVASAVGYRSDVASQSRHRESRS